MFHPLFAVLAEATGLESAGSDGKKKYVNHIFWLPRGTFQSD